MARQVTPGDQVIDMMLQAHTCDLEDVMRRCPNLTWNQVFLAVDHLTRTGQVRLVPAKRGSYTLTLLRQQGSRPDHMHSRPNHKEVFHADINALGAI